MKIPQFSRLAALLAALFLFTGCSAEELATTSRPTSTPLLLPLPTNAPTATFAPPSVTPSPAATLEPAATNTLQPTLTSTLDPTATVQPPLSASGGGVIAFVSERGDAPGIVIMNADGSDPTNISNSPSREQWPSWSPDGTWIAFQSDRDGNWEDILMNAGGGEQQRLTHNEVKDSGTSLAPVISSRQARKGVSENAGSSEQSLTI